MQQLVRSQFQGAGTMGALPGTRPVTLRGSTTASGLFSPNFFNHSDQIKIGLQNRGFDVINVRASTPNTFGDYILNIEIETNAFDQFSAEEVRQSAIAAIEAITANWGLSSMYSNTTLSVVYDAAGGGAGGAFNPPSSYDLTNPDNQAPESDAWIAFWQAMGFTVSPSIAATLIIGGLAAYVILKR